MNMETGKSNQEQEVSIWPAIPSTRGLSDRLARHPILPLDKWQLATIPFVNTRGQKMTRICDDQDDPSQGHKARIENVQEVFSAHDESIISFNKLYNTKDRPEQDKRACSIKGVHDGFPRHLASHSS